MINCFIDDREQSRVKPAYDFFTSCEYNVFVMELPVGDYVFTDTDTGLSVAFEYKTIADYLDSIVDNRVFNQALEQSDNFDYHFVIIVGTYNELNRLIRERKQYTGRYMSLKEYYGTFGSLLNVTSILQVPNMNHGFQLMESTARHCLSLKPVLKRYRKSRGSPALRLLANNVNGIGYSTAELICRNLGLESVADVLKLSKDDLLSVKGIGEVKADNILRQVHGEFGL